VYIGNLHVNITEEDLLAVLQQVGPVDSVNIHRDEVGTSKGYAFARFLRVEDAQKAQTTLAGLELAGRSIKVGFVTDSGNSNNNNQQGGGAAGVQQYGSTNWKLDDDEGSGMQMNSQSRSMLMAKLGKAAGIEMPQAPPPPAPPPAAVLTNNSSVAGNTAQAPPVSGQLSTCFVMKNMFVLEEETEEDWAQYIKEDVTEECGKFGAVLHCHVEDRRPGGMVYMRFPSPQAASEAANSLNGRWFAGRMITVDFINPQEYASLFGAP
jgi:RNA-binding protein 39